MKLSDGAYMLLPGTPDIPSHWTWDTGGVEWSDDTGFSALIVNNNS